MATKKARCPAEDALRALSGKWKLLILREVCKTPKRFGQIRRSLDGVTQKVLTQQLRQMERDGLLQRRIIPGKIIQVEYSLAPAAASLKPAIDILHEWGHTREVEKGASQDRRIHT